MKPHWGPAGCKPARRLIAADATSVDNAGLEYEELKMLKQMLVGLAVFLAIAVPGVWAQTKGPKVIRRAQPPKFSADRTFFGDAFQEGLVGERPANLGQAPAMAAGSSPAAGSASPAGGGGTGTWASLISSGTIEDEIKATKLLVDQGVTTPSDFAGKGYKLARREFSILAMLFAIINEYDGDVRWKNDAAIARDTFARTAANAKVGTVQVFNEAKQRKSELQELLGGSSPFTEKAVDPKNNWGAICDRAPLMQYLEKVWEPEMKPLLSDKAQFTANADKLAHSAEMFAAIGDVLAKDGMMDADSDEYKELCFKLRDAAKEIAEAARSKNFDAASKASSEVGKSCTECHENYRS